MNEDIYILTEKEKKLFAQLRKKQLSFEDKRILERALKKAVKKSQRALWWQEHFAVQPVFFKPAVGFASLLVVLSVGAGVGRAASVALPGEVLYKAKTNLYEPVGEAFSREDALVVARLRIQARLKEAEILVERGGLGQAEKEQLEQLITSEVVLLESQGISREEIIAETKNFSQKVELTLDEKGEIVLRVKQVILTPSNFPQRVEEDVVHDDRKDKAVDEHEADDRDEERSSLKGEKKVSKEKHDEGDLEKEKEQSNDDEDKSNDTDEEHEDKKGSNDDTDTSESGKDGSDKEGDEDKEE